MNLSTPIGDANKLLKMRLALLEKLAITTVKDLLFHIPHRYDDFRIVSKIKDIQPGEVVTVHGTIVEIKNQFLRGGRKLQKAVISDETGEVHATWFNQPYIAKMMKAGDRVAFSGRVNEFSHKMTFESPEYEIISPEGKTLHTGRLAPIYPETKGLSSKWLRRQIYNMLTATDEMLEEYLPDELLKENDLPTIRQTLSTIHFPDNLEEAEIARKRLGFEELFFLHLSALQRKKQWKQSFASNRFTLVGNEEKILKLKDSLPFKLTNAQENALKDIFIDFVSEKPMNRLLEGDVGSGKTVVAALAMYVAYLNGYQSLLLAPTEILAQQHFQTIERVLSPFGVKSLLITGSHKKETKKVKGKDTNTLDADIVIGTHAILNEKLKLDNVGLVVIDEQQRFGVEQRALIRQKGKHPHLLTMTATPIPRTVALAMYGDLDLSYLDEMPKGRIVIKTWLVPEEKRAAGYEWIRKEINATDSQVFIICPFIEESENMTTIKAATKEFARLQKEIFPDLKLGLLHGKMKSKEKDEVLAAFKEKKFDILVATPVVEVGIDIPNATIIVIEAAERFGLAQLHQLRGRVGRGKKQSYCLLFTDHLNPVTFKRLKAMETLHNGAELAELDFTLRGPGEMYGTLQHGSRMLKVASFADRPLVIKTKQVAEIIFPNLEKYPKLVEKLTSEHIKDISPD